MKGKQFTEVQIVSITKEASTENSTIDYYSIYGIS